MESLTLYPREADHRINIDTHIMIYKGHLFSGHSKVIQQDKGNVTVTLKELGSVFVSEVAGDMVVKIG